MPSAGLEDLALAALTSLGNRLPVAFVIDGEWAPSPELRTAVRDTGGEVLFSGGEKGIAACWNKGTEWGLRLGADAVLFLNDDVELPSWDWPAHLQGVLEAHPKRKCTCFLDRLTASTLFRHLTPEPDNPGWGHKPWPVRPGISVAPAGKDNPYPQGFEFFAMRFAQITDDWLPCRMNGAAFMLRRDTIERVGLFDEGFGWPGCYEDMDYWMRLLQEYGSEAVGTCARVFIHHWRGATMTFLDRIAAEAGVARNGAYFKGKWHRQNALLDWFSKANATPVGQPLPKGCPL